MVLFHYCPSPKKNPNMKTAVTRIHFYQNVISEHKTVFLCLAHKMKISSGGITYESLYNRDSNQWQLDVTMINCKNLIEKNYYKKIPAMSLPLRVLCLFVGVVRLQIVITDESKLNSAFMWFWQIRFLWFACYNCNGIRYKPTK